MAEYPVLEVVDELKEKLSLHPIVILQAPPGAGKSTVLPLQLLSEPWLKNKKIIMLEPRRLATRSVAWRMASLINESLGETIGYRVRFENKTGPSTCLEVVTEGILTRMAQGDSTLEGIGLVIFDEFHERSLHADLALAFCVHIQRTVREDLRILIMSATLDAGRISKTLANASVIKCEGRNYPVDFRYAPFDPTMPLTQQVAKVILKALRENKGDLLVFLPGTGEIHGTASMLEEENIPGVIHKLYGDLTLEKQQAAILPDEKGRRKIVLATSIAETSLTIEGVSVVIDSGWSRLPRFDPRSGLSKLETVKVTKDSADQRAGRAGRLGPGVCYRLWKEGTTANLVPNREPEILEADLSSLVLELFQWGMADFKQLLWIDQPPAGHVSQAKELLEQLGAIENEKITPRGREMIRLPTHPRLAHLLTSEPHGRSAIACDVAALLEERDPLPKESGVDITIRIEVLNRWRKGEAVNADREVLKRISRLSSVWRKSFSIEEKVDSSPSLDCVGALIAEAYPERIACKIEKQANRFKMANGRLVKISKNDPMMNAEWLAIAQADAGATEGIIYSAAPLHPDELSLFSKNVENIQWDESREMIAATEGEYIGSLEVSARRMKNPSLEKIKDALLSAIREKGIKWCGGEEALRRIQPRVMSLKLWRPDENWPAFGEKNLLDTAEQWLSPFLNNITKKNELLNLEWQTIFKSMLSRELSSKLDRLAPEKIQVPSGSVISLNYHADGQPPELAVRLQEVFGLMDTPVINEGKTRVIMHLLSPAYRPVQVTSDLRNFWTSTYHEIRKELRIRYPKHFWPEDPLTARAVKGVKKKG